VDDLSRRLQIIEEKLEFHESSVDALNDVIVDQQKQIAELEEQLTKLASLLLRMEEPPSFPGDDSPPPHY
jgi:SlyX protein